MKHLKLIVIFFALLVSLLAACAAPAAPEPAEAPATEAPTTKAPTTEESATEAPQPTAAEPVTLRMQYLPASSGVDDVAMQDFVKRFEEQNPDIKIVVDIIGRDAHDQKLVLDIASGNGPDIARLLIPSDFALRDQFLDLRPYVAEPAYWDENLGDANKLFSGGTDAIVGLYTDRTVTGPYINRTLFEQAKIPVPSDTSDQVTWQQWAEATAQVRDALNLPEAMVMDASAHRFATIAVSMGAKYIGADGNPDLVGDQSLHDALALLVDWHNTGIMPMQVWAGGEGQALDATGEFINGKTPFYLSGSWQVSRFETEIGGNFDWEVVPEPCGTEICTGMPGGGFLAAFKYTQYPEQVARFMDFMAAEENYSEWGAKTLLFPVHKGIIEKGITFETKTPLGANAMSAWLEANVDPAANSFVASPYSGTIFSVTAPRIKQAVSGELTVDQAIERMQQDVEDAMNQ